MPERACYFAAECAALLGMSLDTFYRQREALHGRGMPHSRTLGRLRIDRAQFDAWRRGRLPPAPANDQAADEDWRAVLAREYAGG